MKNLILTSLVLLLTAPAFAQVKDSTARKRHRSFVPGKSELRIAPGFTVGQPLGYYLNSGPTFQLDYIRRLSGGHHLRVGLRVQEGNTGAPVTRTDVDGPYTSGGNPLPAVRYIRETRTSVFTNQMAGLSIGYEYRFLHKRKVQPVIGADIFGAYHVLSGEVRQTAYTETVTSNPSPDTYSYTIQYTRRGESFVTDHRFMLGIIPRIGVHWQASRVFGLGVQLTPLIGYSNSISAPEQTMGDRPDFPGFIKSYWFFQQNAELSLSFRFPGKRTHTITHPSF